MSGQTDASDALLCILALRHRAEGGVEQSVLQMIGTGQTQISALADLFGIRHTTDGLMVASGHTGLANAMFRTKWGNADLRKLLLQLEGAVMTDNPHWFGSIRKQGCVHSQRNTVCHGRGNYRYRRVR